MARNGSGEKSEGREVVPGASHLDYEGYVMEKASLPVPRALQF